MKTLKAKRKKGNCQAHEQIRAVGQKSADRGDPVDRMRKQLKATT